MNRAAVGRFPIQNSAPGDAVPVAMLRDFLIRAPAIVTVHGLQHDLRLSEKEAVETLQMLVDVEYLAAVPGAAGQFQVTATATRLIDAPVCPPISRLAAMRLLTALNEDAAAINAAAESCRVTAVTAFGGVLDASVRELPFLSAVVDLAFTTPAIDWEEINTVRERLLSLDESLCLRFRIPGPARL
ncbi:MAG: hypothetical protein H7274_00595 [Rhodoferax sp.]|nr:hypothetical protein [Rhodoferax sp.]